MHSNTYTFNCLYTVMYLKPKFLLDVHTYMAHPLSLSKYVRIMLTYNCYFAKLMLYIIKCAWSFIMS